MSFYYFSQDFTSKRNKEHYSKYCTGYFLTLQRTARKYSWMHVSTIQDDITEISRDFSKTISLFFSIKKRCKKVLTLFPSICLPFLQQQSLLSFLLLCLCYSYVLLPCSFIYNPMISHDHPVFYEDYNLRKRVKKIPIRGGGLSSRRPLLVKNKILFSLLEFSRSKLYT